MFTVKKLVSELMIFLDVLHSKSDGLRMNRGVPHERRFDLKREGVVAVSADDARWQDTSVDEVQKAARSLLEKSTAKLNEAGAETTEGVVYDEPEG